MLAPVYRIGKSAMHALPAWALRARPFDVYEIRLEPQPSATRPSATPGFEARWVTSRDEAAALRPIADPQNIADWNGEGRLAAAAWQGATPIGAVWIARDCFREAELGIAFDLAPDEAWLHSAAVAPDHRRRGVYSQLLDCALDGLRQDGLRRVLLGVTTGNEPSRRAHQRQHAQRLGGVRAVRCLGLSACTSGGAVRRLSRRPYASRGPIRFRVEG